MSSTGGWSAPPYSSQLGPSPQPHREQTTTSPSTDFGVVAIMDALGAKSFTRDEVERFLGSRQRVHDGIQTLPERYLRKFDQRRLKRFHFNDTVIVCYLLDDLSPKAFEDFAIACQILRAFQMLSFREDLLFRGSVSVGALYRVSEEENIIMGPVVSDAATWYEKADWIGINATPDATAYIDQLIGTADAEIQHLLVSYPVPLKDGSHRPLRAVNWPKGLFVDGLRPENLPGGGRHQLQMILNRKPPSGSAVQKHRNALAFFDAVYTQQNLAQFEASPSPAS